jgi:hypothetical protein
MIPTEATRVRLPRESGERYLSPMLGLLRQCRALALTLLLAAPGLGGTWLTLAHPCPVDMPWLAQGDHHDHQAQTSHSHGDAPEGSAPSCNCVGACHSGAATLVSISTGPTSTIAGAGWSTPPSALDSDAPVQHRLHRQPPATAPPLA